MQFVHDATSGRVVFGVGAIRQVKPELAGLGARPLVIIDDTVAKIAASSMPMIHDRSVAVIDHVRQHVPVADAHSARRTARECEADCILVLGGGSAVGLAKAVALTEALPILAVPTTYAGSEMTPVWGLTDEGVKTTGRNPLVAPRVVIYDPELNSLASLQTHGDERAQCGRALCRCAVGCGPHSTHRCHGVSRNRSARREPDAGRSRRVQC